MHTSVFCLPFSFFISHFSVFHFPAFYSSFPAFHFNINYSTFDIQNSSLWSLRVFTGNFSGFTDLCHLPVGLRLPGEPARDSFV
jgi:hypothetical protein